MSLGTVTNFPSGINAGDESGNSSPLEIGGVAITATAAELNQAAHGINDYAMGYASAGAQIFAGTVIVPASGSTAFKPTGIATAVFMLTKPQGPLSSTAGTVGGFVATAGACGSGGTVTIYGYDAFGTASSTAGTATYLVVGT